MRKHLHPSNPSPRLIFIIVFFRAHAAEDAVFYRRQYSKIKRYPTTSRAVRTGVRLRCRWDRQRCGTCVNDGREQYTSNCVIKKREPGPSQAPDYTQVKQYRALMLDLSCRLEVAVVRCLCGDGHGGRHFSM